MSQDTVVATQEAGPCGPARASHPAHSGVLMADGRALDPIAKVRPLPPELVVAPCRIRVTTVSRNSSVTRKSPGSFLGQISVYRHTQSRTTLPRCALLKTTASFRGPIVVMTLIVALNADNGNFIIPYGPKSGIRYNIMFDIAPSDKTVALPHPPSRRDLSPPRPPRVPLWGEGFPKEESGGIPASSVSMRRGSPRQTTLASR